MTDEQREIEIAKCAKAIEQYLDYDKRTAHQFRKHMEKLINGRSAEQIKRMELARGLI
jgi:hypothetical protein